MSTASLQSAALSSPDYVGDFRERINKDFERLKTLHERKAPATRLVESRVKSIDSVLQDAWDLFVTDDLRNAPIALAAVGGYGRQELNPFSDIDILLLVENKHIQTAERIGKPFIRFLWDIGLEVGHSVRTLDDCIKQARADITVMTNLLEARYSAGDRTLFNHLVSKLSTPKIWPANKFFRAKLEEQERRHHKFADTAYNLEPNVKDGPGGLRDIHTISWVAMRYFGSASLYELVTHEFLNESEYQTLIRGRNYLWKMRNELHFIAGRREDRLLFSHQLKLAKRFGHFDDDSNKAVEKLMKTYFRTVKELRYINLLMLQHFDESILARRRQKVKQLTENFRTVDGFLNFVDPANVEKRPELLIHACALFQRTADIRGIRASTLRQMRLQKHLIDRQLRSKPSVRSALLEIFKNPHRLSETLNLMNETGILGAMVPEFGRVVGQMQYDLFHVYTVDAHSLNVLWHLQKFTSAEVSSSIPLVYETMKRITKPERLFIAGLFHDIAKGQGGDHSELGEQQSYRFCKRTGMSEYDAHFVAWLVRHHLAMSYSSQREDWNDTQVISRFAAKVGDQDHLDNLYLLTVADMQGTGPTVWNEWKGKMLEHAYLATSRALLMGKLPHEELEPRINEIKSDALSAVSTKSEPRKAARIFWELLEDEYFLSYDASTIAWHAQNVTPAGVVDLPLVAFRAHPSIEVVQSLVVAPASEELFTIICGAFDRCFLNVVEARIHPLKTGLTAFSFVVLQREMQDYGATRDPKWYEQEVRKAIIARIIEHVPRTVTPDRVARHVSIPTSVSFSQSPGNDYTMLEVSAHDRPGLLYLVARTLLEHKIRLLSAKITTSGARVEDVFFVVDRDGNLLTDPTVQQTLEAGIFESLNS